MIYSEREILQYIQENDVKFVKLAFCDGNGHLKNLSILASELEGAFSKGIRIAAKKIKGFSMAEGRDLFLFPDIQTMTPLPWRPQEGRVIRMFCYIRYADGTAFEGDSRYFLKHIAKKAIQQGYRFRFGTSCEFMLFLLDDTGKPTQIPHDNAGYCDTAPEDKGENLRRDICLTLEQMGIRPISSHHESAAGQHEIDFDAASALKAADTFLSFKSTVRSVSHAHGVHVSFAPKPLPQTFGNGMHITMTVYHENQEQIDYILQQQATAGIMRRIREFALFTNTAVSSYERLGEFSVPRAVTWSNREEEQLFRLYENPAEEGMTLRAADCACNPYYVFGLMICAAMEGISENLSLPAENAGYEELPHNLCEAIDCAETSNFLKETISSAVLHEILQNRREQWTEHISGNQS
ncbi:MAG: glutamine synthetase [Oscillospiraceae bacterium]|nr:glutamine synthetase [Oscillospiraceae bacterium]